MRLPLIISLCWAADTTRDALIVDANHRPRRLDALDAAATSESLAGARAPPPPRGRRREVARAAVEDARARAAARVAQQLAVRFVASAVDRLRARAKHRHTHAKATPE